MRGMSVAALVCVAASAAVSARPSGLPVEMVETFDRFTPGVALSQQAVTPGCPRWGGSGWVPQLRAGSASDVLLRRTFPVGTSTLSTQISFGVFPEGTTDALVRSEVFVGGLTTSSSMRVVSTGAGFSSTNLFWGGLLFELTCAGQVTFPAPTPMFVVTDVCPGSTSGQFVNTQILVPVGSWMRVEVRTASDGSLVWTMDPMDGSGPVELLRSLTPMPGSVMMSIDLAQMSEAPGEEMLVDNVVVSGISRRPTCPGDATRDGLVNFADLNEVLGSYGQTSATTLQLGDVDGDGTVGFEDLNLVLSSFGATCGCRP